MAEFGRSIEKETEGIEGRWKTLEEKVLKLIEQEDDDEDVQALLQTTGPTRDLPASKIMIKLYCVPFWWAYQ